MSSAEYSFKLFKPIFCIPANSVDPKRSSLIWVHTVCRNDFKNHKQKTKQMTIVVTGTLRVKNNSKTRQCLVSRGGVQCDHAAADKDI